MLFLHPAEGCQRSSLSLDQLFSVCSSLVFNSTRLLKSVGCDLVMEVCETSATTQRSGMKSYHRCLKKQGWERCWKTPKPPHSQWDGFKRRIDSFGRT